MMDTSIVNSCLFSFTFFKEDAANAVKVFNAQFEHFSPTNKLSYHFIVVSMNSVEGMSVCREDHISNIIETLFMNVMDKSHIEDKSDVENALDSLMEHCSPEQKTVLRSISNNVPSMLPELFRSYQYVLSILYIFRDLVKIYRQPISINLPSLAIPIQYYEKQLPANSTDSQSYIDVIEVELYHSNQ